MDSIGYKLLPHQVVIVDDNTGLKWIYDVCPEDLDYLEERGIRDEFGNITLSAPLVAGLNKWNIKTAMKVVDDYMEDVNVPNFPQPKKQENVTSLEELINSTDEQLQHMLTVYGGYRAYLEAELAYIDSKRGMLESTFEEGLNRMIYVLQSQKDKKATKEFLRGEALATNPQLKKVRQDLIETEAIYARVKGLRDAYKASWETVSRVVAIRLSNRNDA